jgi:hypothetical protein
MRDAMAEWTFMTVYGSPLQAAVGIDPAEARRPRQAGTSALQWQLVDARIAKLKAKMPQGDLREPFVRTICYVLMPRGDVDEHGFNAIRRIRAANPDGKTLPLPELTTLTLSEFKALVREQFFMLLIDQPAEVAAGAAAEGYGVAARGIRAAEPDREREWMPWARPPSRARPGRHGSSS